MAPPNEPTADHQKQNEDYHHINHNKNEPSHLPIHGNSNNTKMRHSSNSFSSNGAGTTGTRPYHQESDDTMDNTNNHLQTMQHNHTTMKQQHHHHHHHRPQMSASSAQPTPLFERLVTEEVQEIKAYARIIESQQRRLVELERVHGDLEARLELESNRRKQLESTLEAREREWANKFQELSKDRDNWKGVVQMEQTKNARLIDQVVRKDQDIHRMLQRKVQIIITGFVLEFDHNISNAVSSLFNSTIMKQRVDYPFGMCDNNQQVPAAIEVSGLWRRLPGPPRLGHITTRVRMRY